MHPRDEFARSVDAMIDAYVAWREESVGVWSAYRAWSAATEADIELAFASYRAALDREGQAGTTYAHFSHQVERLLCRRRNRPPMPLAPPLVTHLGSGWTKWSTSDRRGRP